MVGLVFCMDSVVGLSDVGLSSVVVGVSDKAVWRCPVSLSFCCKMYTAGARSLGAEFFPPRELMNDHLVCFQKKLD